MTSAPVYVMLPSASAKRQTPSWVFGLFACVLILGAVVLLNGSESVGVEADHKHHHAESAHEQQHEQHDHQHHWDEHDHHEHEHGYEPPEHGLEHHCIHDKIKHPPIVRATVGESPLVPSVNNSLGASTEEMRRTTVADSQGTNQDVASWSGVSQATRTWNSATCVADNPHNTATAQAIRIELVDGGISTLDSAYQTYLTSTLMPALKQYFENTLQVARFTSNLKCSQTGTQSSIPLDMGTTCNGVGYAADFVLFYAASDSTTCQANTDTLAYAGPLETTSCDRPVVGYIHFCKNQLTSTDTATAQHTLQYKTGLHETIHALGFTSRMYAYYHKTANPWGPRTARDSDGIPNSGTTSVTLSTNGLVDLSPTTTIYNPDTSYFGLQEADATLGHTVSSFKADMASTTTAAKTQFDCTTLSRVEVENQGAEGSFASHWEKRIFGDELMTAVVTSNLSPLSSVTLGLLSDTAFYKIPDQTPTYSSGQLTKGAEENLWLNSAGCSAVTNKCIDSGTAANSVWCTTANNVEACTYDGGAKGVCDKTTQTSSYAAANYQYFGATDEFGGVPFADYCPFVKYYTNRVCTNTADGTAEGTSVTAQGQTYGANSRCFSSSLWSPTYVLQQKTVGCYTYECISTSEVAVTVVSGATNYVFSCTTSGTAHTISGWSGSLTCPDPTSKTVCGLATTFQSLSALSVSSAGTAIISSPGFASSYTSYNFNVGNTTSTIDIVATSTSSGATVTIGGTAATTSGTSHTRSGVALTTGTNTLPIVVTAGGISKTYEVTVIKADSSTTGIGQTWTLSYDYNAVGVHATFLTTFRAELMSLLGIGTSQITMLSVSSGSTIVSFTFNYVAGAASPASLDATATTLFNNKGSALFTTPSAFPVMSTATHLSSAVAVPCPSTCSTSCNYVTGQCPGASDDESFLDKYPFAIYAIAALGLILLACIIYCIYRACCAKKPETAGDKKTFAAPSRTVRTEDILQRPAQQSPTDASRIEVEMKSTGVPPTIAANTIAAATFAPTRTRVTQERDESTETSQSRSESDDDDDVAPIAQRHTQRQV